MKSKIQGVRQEREASIQYHSPFLKYPWLKVGTLCLSLVLIVAILKTNNSMAKTAGVAGIPEKLTDWLSADGHDQKSDDLRGGGST